MPPTSDVRQFLPTLFRQSAGGLSEESCLEDSPEEPRRTEAAQQDVALFKGVVIVCRPNGWPRRLPADGTGLPPRLKPLPAGSDPWELEENPDSAARFDQASLL